MADKKEEKQIVKKYKGRKGKFDYQRESGLFKRYENLRGK